MPSRPFLAKSFPSAAALALLAFSPPPAAADEAAPGSLSIRDRPEAVCPLRHTDVKAEISGFLARVTVTQEFENPLPETIEAVYTFPLSQRAAVDDMTMVIGDRVIRGDIKRREEAQRIYENARNQGQTAALLDQERPNIFTQSVTNIGAGMKVKVVISYVETLRYEAGSYAFSFPMVVGPRYVPAHTDGSRITPPVAAKGVRAGHDISLQVSLDAGVPLAGLTAKSHPVAVARPNPHAAVVQLQDYATIPNKDFLLNYAVAGGRIEDALLTHHGKNGGFFTFLLQPPERVAESEITPKEIVFVVDTSGSMHGFPLDKAKEVIKLAMDGMHPRDTFNLITFSGDTHILFPQPVSATPENIRKAQAFLLSREGGGGTEMMKAIRAALDPSDSQEHVRVVCFITDGYVGNDMEILGEVKRHPNARVFSFGVGSSVNRFLLDKMAEEGRGEVEYVALTDEGTPAAQRLHERVRTPLLTDVAIDWNGLPVAEVYPQRIPDRFSAKPVVLTGRYTGAATGSFRLTGKIAGRAFSRRIDVRLPADEPQHDVLAKLWARTKIDQLMSEDWTGMQNGSPRADLREAITELGLDFRIMTQFTSFVAVERSTVIESGQPRVIEVPVEMPYGVSHEGVFGARQEQASVAKSFAIRGIAGGVIGGVPAEGDFRRSPAPVAPPPPPRVNRPDAGRDRPAQLLDEAASKLDAQLAAAMSANSTGTLRVKVWLSDATPQVLARLRQAGLKISSAPAGVKIIVGTISASDLRKLAALDAVIHVSEDKPLPA